MIMIYDFIDQERIVYIYVWSLSNGDEAVSIKR